ncbi:class I SAM-dependent RNA methyltransferase [Athalassotoga saccharophila]|uniref:class I SAM-dependent RNA methyltransferase n=1 Tax=Athalassotoga saccharophila TaxID=1441386 RepID=UPI001379E008|nr:class I SAM-dependent RNA methyltransferase [Athalassotoga saccharophila]BBJ28487.1 23S rRNA (uracil-C(5))-methyltransferase RlmCD [Athalassotoga saccharophila]
MIVEKIVAGGYGLSRKDGKVYFIRNAYPGEDVDIRIEKDQKDFVIASVERINSQSPYRRKAICEYFGTCGGCEWMDLDYRAQLQYKKEIFLDQMKHAGIDISPSKIIPTSEYNYRNKVEFVVVNGQAGFFGRNSHRFVEIEKCHIISENLNTLRREIKDLRGFSHLVLRDGIEKKMAIFVSTKMREIPNSSADEVVSLISDSKIVLSGRQRTLKGRGYLEIKINDIVYRIPPKSFFQVNYEGAKILADQVVEYAQDGKKLADLYCGVGFFSLQLAKKFEHITGIESSPSSIIEARKNAIINEIKNLDFKVGRTADFNLKGYSTVVMDPPRSGIDRGTMQNILNAKPERLVYVSCDVSTFSRDARILVQKLYNIKDAVIVDMFPQTHHFEIVSLFERVI